ncbi:MAG: threonylcarbamoyl-AMP synthase [Lachnospiraceae bacterium]|nr:threonylcarbamoyl-AMP synthase [Lachnospiraceae bacterium]
MKTQIVRDITEDAIERAGQIIKEGGLVAFPTETVYGLGGDAFNPGSSKKIYAAKGRPSDNPLIVHIAYKKDLYEIAEDIPDLAFKLMDSFCPGPLTLILKKKPSLPKETTGGLGTVAVRMPSDPTANAFIKASGGFVAAPSANISGRPSPTDVRYVIEDLDGRVDMILDGGSSPIGLESTIVDLTEDRPVILRPGFITAEMLCSVAGPVSSDPGSTGEDTNAPPKAPGMKYRHYAPKGDLTVVYGTPEKVIEYININTARCSARGLKTGVIAGKMTADRYNADSVKNLGDRDDPAEISSSLYRVLREFDDEGTDVIYSESFEGPGLYCAVMNRLLKAAGRKTVNAGE